MQVWPCVLQGCPLCSRQDSRCPSKASGLVCAVARCLQAVCRLPRCPCTGGTGSTLLIWGLHTCRCTCTVRLVFLLLCVRLSREAVSVLLKASTHGNNARSTGKVACSQPAQSWLLYSSPVVSLVSTWWSSCPFGSLLGPLALRCDHCFSLWCFSARDLMRYCWKTSYDQAGLIKEQTLINVTFQEWSLSRTYLHFVWRRSAGSIKKKTGWKGSGNYAILGYCDLTVNWELMWWTA